MKKLLLAITAVLIMTGCSKKDDTPTPPDAYAEFKADATPRWENGTSVEQNDQSANTFIIDAGGTLFGSTKYKTGRIMSGGNSYEFIEFSGTPAVGTPTEASIRTQDGTTALAGIEILKSEAGKLWIVFKETANSAERRVVQ